MWATATSRDALFVANVEDVAPDGTSEPLTHGVLLGSHRPLDDARTWRGSDGRPLMPYHPFTRAASAPVTPGKLTRYDIGSSRRWPRSHPATDCG